MEGRKLKTEEIIGKRFGRIVVTRLAYYKYEGKARQKRPQFEYVCDCGSMRVTDKRNIMKKKHPTRSCGCMSREKFDEYNANGGTKTHGLTSNGKITAGYRAWNNMKQRCYNPKLKSYHRYGGRGILVCDEWRNSLERFLKDMGEPPKGLTLDRVDNDKGYSKENCRWATRKQQVANRTQGGFYTSGGKPTWCYRKIKQLTLDGRVVRIWDSITAAEEFVGVCSGQITAVAKGYKYSKSAGGFKWEYA